MKSIHFPLATLLTGAALGISVPAARAATSVFTVIDDTCLIQEGGGDDNNYGGRDEIITSNSSTSGANRRFGLLRFDLSSLAGQFASIDSITLELRLRVTRAVPTTGQILDIFRVAEANAGWVEGTGLAGDALANNVPNPGTATYRALSDDVTVGSRTLWAGTAGLNTAGTDYFGTALATTNTFNASSGYVAGGVITLTFTASGFTLDQMVNDWIADGASNAGLLIRGRSGTANGQIFFDSLETPAAQVGEELPARLTINYTAIPEPGTLVTLMAAGFIAMARRPRRVRVS